MFIFVDRNPATVAFACDFLAFSEKNTHHHFYNSIHGRTVWTNNVFEILQREVSWARVPEIVRQNDRALFRPKSKEITGNSMITFVSDDEILQEDATFNFRENMWHSVNNPVKTEGSPATFPPWRNWTHLRSTGLQHRRLRSQRGQAWARWRDSWQTRPSNGEAGEITTHGSRSHQIEQNQGYLWKAGSSQHDFHFERTEKQ